MDGKIFAIVVVEKPDRWLRITDCRYCGRVSRVRGTAPKWHFVEDATRIVRSHLSR
jgi:hypothetical protein